jgi:hypothetical protein
VWHGASAAPLHVNGGPVPAVFTYTGRSVRPAIVLLVLLAVALPSAALRTLSLPEIDEAIRTGQTRIAADRAKFHLPYRILVNQAPVDYIEVITPYRRVALAADERAQLGDRSFGQRQALDLLGSAGGQFDFVVELTFHPLNTYIGIPSYDVVILRDGVRVMPAALDRQPRFGARVEGFPPALPTPGGRIAGRAQPILGGTLTARFAAESINPMGITTLVVSEQGNELARTTIDLARLR